MISIIIPTLNEESTIEHLLLQLRQGMGNLEYEIIVSDGNSKDKTVIKAKSLADTVLVHTLPHRQTIAQAKNYGAAHAHGNFFVFMDADTSIENANIFFNKALAVFKNFPAINALTASLRVKPELATRRDIFFSAVVNFVHWILNNVFGFGSGSGEFQMVRAESFKAVGGYREDLAVTEDNDLFWRLAKHGKTYYDGSLVVFHSGRRAHKMGWLRLLFLWFINGFTVLIFKRSVSSEWKPIR